MAPISLIYTPIAFLLLLAWGPYRGAAEVMRADVQYTNCNEVFNRYRAKVGLSAFTNPAEPGSTMPLAGGVWDVVCNALLAVDTRKKPPTKGLKGDFAYMVTGQRRSDCRGAVRYWNDAVSNFKGPPPTFTNDEVLYRSPLNASLVSLYNPSPNATMSCTIFSCTYKAKNPREAHGMLCLTAPSPLKLDKPPFTEAQWQRIVDVVNSSEATALASFSPIVAVVWAATLTFSTF